jgi:hypothetical protein
MRVSWERTAALAGVAFVVLFVVAFSLGIDASLAFRRAPAM